MDQEPFEAVTLPPLEADDYAWLESEQALLEAVRDLWEARCSREAFAERGPVERGAAPFVSFGVTAAKRRMYAICEAMWGSSFDNGPRPSAATGCPDDPGGWENR